MGTISRTAFGSSWQEYGCRWLYDALDEASITVIVCRIAAGRPADDIVAPDLHVHDAFMRGMG